MPSHILFPACKILFRKTCFPFHPIHLRPSVCVTTLSFRGSIVNRMPNPQRRGGLQTLISGCFCFRNMRSPWQRAVAICYLTQPTCATVGAYSRHLRIHSECVSCCQSVSSSGKTMLLPRCSSAPTV